MNTHIIRRYGALALLASLFVVVAAGCENEADRLRRELSKLKQQHAKTKKELQRTRQELRQERNRKESAESDFWIGAIAAFAASLAAAALGFLVVRTRREKQVLSRFARYLKSRLAHESSP
jgi:hypothetical protein